MWNGDSAESNVDIAVTELINAGRMVRAMDTNIDRYKVQLNQSIRCTNNAKSTLEYLNTQVASERNVQSEYSFDRAYKRYSKALIRDYQKKIDEEKSRLASQQENNRSLTDKIESMKAQKIIYEERVLTAVAAWLAADRAADQDAAMRAES